MPYLWLCGRYKHTGQGRCQTDYDSFFHRQTRWRLSGQLSFMTKDLFLTEVTEQLHKFSPCWGIVEKIIMEKPYHYE